MRNDIETSASMYAPQKYQLSDHEASVELADDHEPAAISAMPEISIGHGERTPRIEVIPIYPANLRSMCILPALRIGQ